MAWPPPSLSALGLIAASCLASGTAAAVDTAEPDPPMAADPRLGVALELALMPVFTVQQIEGPARDDLITRDIGVSALFSAAWALSDWLEPSVVAQLDAGSIRRATFTRPDAAGVASEAAVVQGDYWELWLTLMLRARVEPMFFELGWAPLIVRHDTSRSDLPNVSGETDGDFIGSRSVAWSVGVGGTIALSQALSLTLRLQFRIRYLVERGGEALADGEETGQMRLWPLVGLQYRI